MPHQEVVFFLIFIAALEDQSLVYVWLDVNNPSGQRCNSPPSYTDSCEDLQMTWGDGTTPLNSSGTITSGEINDNPVTDGPYLIETASMGIRQFGITKRNFALCEYL